jgi:hypothetical protein
MGAGFNNLLCRSLLFLLPLPSPQLLSITFHPARTSLPVFYFWLVSILRFMKQLVPVWIGNSGLQSHTGVRNPGALFFEIKNPGVLVQLSGGQDTFTKAAFTVHKHL